MNAERNLPAAAILITGPIFKVKASNLLALLLLVSLFMPTLHPLPASLGPLDRSLEEFLDFALIGAWLVLLVLGRLRKVPIRPRYLLLALWLMPAAVAVSILLNTSRPGVPGTDDVYAILWTLRPIVIIQLVGYLCWVGGITEKSIHALIAKFHRVIGLALIITCTIAILQAFKLPLIFRFIEILYGKQIIYQGAAMQRSVQAIEVYNRATSIFPWANHFGMFVAVAMLLLIPAALRRRGLSRWIAFIPLVFGLAGLVLSGSRTALFTLALGVFLLLRHQRRLLPYLIIGVLALLALFSLTTQLIGQNPRVLEVVSYIQGEGPPPPTVTTRLRNYQSMLDELFRNWWNVPAGFTVTAYNRNHPQANRIPFDSEYLKNFMLFGLLGLTAFIGSLAGLAIFTSRVVRRYGQHSPNAQLAETLFAIIIPLGIASLTQDVWSLAKVIHLIFFMLGALNYINSLMPLPIPKPDA